MQISWGNKILIVFVAFAGFIGLLVYKCMNQNFELVSKNYYQEELRYQDKIDGSSNAAAITAAKVQVSGSTVNITLPKEQQGLAVTGEALFYCNANSSADRTIALQVNDQGIMQIDRKKLAPVTYNLKLTWQIGDQKFYSEHRVEL